MASDGSNEVGGWAEPSAQAGDASLGSGFPLKYLGIGCVSVLAIFALAAVAAALVYSDDEDAGDDVAGVDVTATAESAQDGEQAETPTATSEPEPTPTEESTPTPEPSPTQSPTPEPTPTAAPMASFPRSECYEPRPSEDEHDLTLLPAEPNSIFQQCQLVAFYGFPGEPLMGVVGEYEPEEMIRRLNEQSAGYEDHNGFRTAVPALELIFAVAQGSQTEDGTYLARMSSEMVERWIAIAEEHDLLLIFDIQIGSSTVEAEVEHLLPYLENPRVHLALDPEFVTNPETPPGQAIGSLEASEINRAQQMLKDVVEEHNLPNKILVVHQFIPEMILNKPDIENVPGVDLVIHQDGFGAPEDKIANYDRFVAAEGAKHGGFKVFYQQDEPVLTPEQLMTLTPQPDVITYQ